MDILGEIISGNEEAQIQINALKRIVFLKCSQSNRRQNKERWPLV